MGISKKSISLNKFGLNGLQKRTGIYLWRFFFKGIERNSGDEKNFSIEFEILNPGLQSDEPLLGFKPRVQISSDDLQYALAGTKSAEDIRTESLVQPSYAAVRFQMLGSNAKRICRYLNCSEININTKNFEIRCGNILFNFNSLSGFLDLTQEENDQHPEYMCDSGYVSWKITYDIWKDFACGFKNSDLLWFPLAVQANFAGTFNFNGTDYVINPKKSSGYIERFWGKSFPETWFHISSSNLTSIISGHTLFNSSFAVKGIFDGRLSFLANFEDTEIKFLADSSKRDYSVAWDCTQAPVNDEDDDELLHWTVSINSKEWIIDIDVFCKVRELETALLEAPEGNRRVLNIVQSSSGYGELKLFKRRKSSLEQMEYARLSSVICEFGHIEDSEI